MVCCWRRGRCIFASGIFIRIVGNMHIVILQVERRQPCMSISPARPYLRHSWHCPFYMFVTELRRHSGTNWFHLSTEVCSESLDYVIGKACVLMLTTTWYFACSTNYWLPTFCVYSSTCRIGCVLATNVFHCEYLNAFSIWFYPGSCFFPLICLRSRLHRVKRRDKVWVHNTRCIIAMLVSCCPRVCQM